MAMRAKELTTERLLLRLPMLADAEQIFTRYGQDPSVCRFMSWVPHRTIGDTVAFLQRFISENAARRSYGFLIFSRASTELIGSVAGTIDQHRMQFGYCLSEDAWGNGYATEAASAFVAAALEIDQIRRVQAFCDVENAASAHVLEKVGLEREGTLSRYMVLPNLGEEPRDMYCYAKTRAGRKK